MAEPKANGDSAQETVGALRCVACARKIGVGATKCAECGSFQNWRRQIQISSTVLALLVALFSVTGIVAPVLVKTFRAESSTVQVSYRSASLEPGFDLGAPAPSAAVGRNLFGQVKITVLLTNPGERPGFIQSARVTLPHNSPTTEEVDLYIKPNEAVVEAGAFRLAELRGEYEVYDKDNSSGGSLSFFNRVDASLTVDFIQYDLTEQTVTTIIPKGTWQAVNPRSDGSS